MTKISNFENSRWRTAAIVKMVLSQYLSRESSDFNEIWCAGTNVDSKTVTWQRIEILQNQNGWQPPYWKSLLAISQRFIVRLTWNLVWRRIITLRHRSHWQKKTKFLSVS